MLVKVGKVTNLSDARYCAGMGVDFLGFNVCPDTPSFIDTNLYQDIRGWVTGPKVVAEIYQPVPDIDAVIKEYAPDFVEVNAETYNQLADKTSLPFILYLTRAELQSHSTIPTAEYILIDQESLPFVRAITNSKVLIKIDKKESLESLPANTTGIALSGSDEIRPGYKEYDELADILEALDQ
ncbi:MAG TPA: hypothetical protein VD927_13390 [Chryseosolibacter sp.]|nr:hypothetical protein [Chryseosolibacter sp.]